MTGPPRETWFSRLYDAFLAPVELLGLRRARREIVREAAGRVLEIGTGTGLNLPHYRRAREVVAFDPDPGMLRRAVRRGETAAVPVRLVRADAQALPFGDATFDTAVITWVLCTVPDPEAALREVRRVLKPGGMLLLMEHVRAHSPTAARLQDRVTPAWSRVAGGCHLNRDTLATLTAVGFERERLDTSFGGVVVRARFRSGVHA